MLRFGWLENTVDAQIKDDLKYQILKCNLNLNLFVLSLIKMSGEINFKLNKLYSTQRCFDLLNSWEINS